MDLLTQQMKVVGRFRKMTDGKNQRLSFSSSGFVLQLFDKRFPLENKNQSIR